jgi:hypothetical protein
MAYRAIQAYSYFCHVSSISVHLVPWVSEGGSVNTTAPGELVVGFSGVGANASSTPRMPEQAGA